MYFCAQEQSAHDLACDCSTSSVHKSMSQTNFFCSACLLVLQVMCQSCALCSCTHKCQSQTNIFCSACLLVLQSSQPALLFCCPPFTCLWFPTLRQPWKSPNKRRLKNGKEKKRKMNIDLAVLLSHDTRFVMEHVCSSICFCNHLVG